MWSLSCGAGKDIAPSLSDFMQIASTTSVICLLSNHLKYTLNTNFLLLELLNAMCDTQKNGIILFISLFIDSFSLTLLEPLHEKICF